MDGRRRSVSWARSNSKSGVGKKGICNKNVHLKCLRGRSSLSSFPADCVAGLELLLLLLLLGGVPVTEAAASVTVVVVVVDWGSMHRIP